METITTINPATEKEIKTYKRDSKEEALNKVEIANKAYLNWKTLRSKNALN